MKPARLQIVIASRLEKGFAGLTGNGSEKEVPFLILRRFQKAITSSDIETPDGRAVKDPMAMAAF